MTSDRYDELGKRLQDEVSEKLNKWDRRYLELVDFVKEWSEDTSTHIGAVLTQNNRIISVGYNGMPTGVINRPERNERPAKYLYYEHAERNTIYSCAVNGVATGRATMYTTGVPCADCARAVAQAGIYTVVVWKRGSGPEATDRWTDSITAGRIILEEAGVEIVEVDR